MAVTAETGATGVFGTASDVREASTSAVAWPPIIGGAFASAAVSVLLLALGPVDGFAGVKSRGFPNRVLFESLRDRHQGAGHADENDGARLVDRAEGV